MNLQQQIKILTLIDEIKKCENSKAEISFYVGVYESISIHKTANGNQIKSNGENTCFGECNGTAAIKVLEKILEQTKNNKQKEV